AIRPARGAPLDPQLTGGDIRPEAGVVGRHRIRARAGGVHRSTPSRTAPDGSLIAPQTNATSAPATWLVAVPRSWRMASGRWFTPWTNASPFDPPCVLTGRAPSGHRVAPLSMNGPPPPRPQHPYCSAAGRTPPVH